MFDDETEPAAAAAGLEVAHPSAELRHRLDSKIVTTQLGNEAGVPSAPNTLGRATTYDELRALAESAGLGDDLVVQTPYGDSGKTTFFIRGERDWDRDAGEMADQELKVMKRINCRAAAVEAVLTRHGTVVGPLMTDLTGHPELTPHKGGWCGNDIFPEALSPEHRERARVLTQQLGDRLAVEGYRGFLEIDYLADVDTGELYLGEINPRISGVTSMTNVTAGAYADVPLFLFHLLEYLDVDYEIDVDDINRRWAETSSVDVWSQIILKDTGDEVEQLTAAPRTGIWRLDEPGGMQFARWGHDWHSLQDESEAFFLRVLGAGRLPLPGRRPRRARRALAHADRGQRADRARARSGSAASTAQFAGAPLARRAGAGPGGRARVQDRLADLRWTTVTLDVPRGRTSRSPARAGRRASRPPGRPTGAGTCATATPRGRPTRWRGDMLERAHARAGAARGSGSSSWPAAATSPRGCSRSTTRRRCVTGCSQAVFAGPSRARAQLRLRPGAARGRRSYASELTGRARARDERLPVGPARRDQRRRARRLARVRRPPRARRRASRSRSSSATCSSVRDDRGGGRDARRGSPCRPSYNLTILDRAGAAATAHVAPDRALRSARRPWRPTTRTVVEWPEHASAVASVEREPRHARADRPRRRPAPSTRVPRAAAARTRLRRRLRDALHRGAPPGRRARSSTAGPASLASVAATRSRRAAARCGSLREKRSSDCSHVAPGQRYSARPSAG